MTTFEKTNNYLWINTDHKKTKKFTAMMDYICLSYQHVLESNKKYTASQFAYAIAQVYSLDNPQNKEVVNYLKTLS